MKNPPHVRAPGNYNVALLHRVDELRDEESCIGVRAKGVSRQGEESTVPRGLLLVRCANVRMCACFV